MQVLPTYLWMAPANRSCCYLHRDNNVREVTMPWDSPVNFRNIKGPDTRLWLSSRNRTQSCGKGGGWDSMRIERRSQVLFDLHIKKEMKTNYHLQAFIFEWMSPLNSLHLITFTQLKTLNLMNLKICDVLMGIWCEVRVSGCLCPLLKGNSLCHFSYLVNKRIRGTKVLQQLVRFTCVAQTTPAVTDRNL